MALDEASEALRLYFLDWIMAARLISIDKSGRPFEFWKSFHYEENGAPKRFKIQIGSAADGRGNNLARDPKNFRRMIKIHLYHRLAPLLDGSSLPRSITGRGAPSPSTGAMFASARSLASASVMISVAPASS
jgi:hypothetical protein